MTAPWIRRHYAATILVAWCGAVFVLCLVLGVMAGLVVEIAVGGVTLFVTWPVAEWALSREASLRRNSHSAPASRATQREDTPAREASN